jgi:hypothetical protein
VIKENNLAGATKLGDDGTSVDRTLSSGGWQEAVNDGKLVQYFKLMLDSVKAKCNFTEEELADVMNRILKVLKGEERGKGLSVSGMRDNGLKCKNSLISPAISR